MTKVEVETTIYQAFVQAQAEFKTPKKTATLVVGGGQKRSYADLGDYLDAVRPALHTNGLALLQPVGYEADCVSIQTVIVNGKGERIESPVLSLLIDKTGNRNAMQALGSTITYARRYSLMCFLGLIGEDDDGETASLGQSKGQHQPKPAQQVAIEQPSPYRDQALKWIADFLHMEPSKGAWNAEAIRVLLGKTSGEATDLELGALIATMQALPLGGGIIMEYSNNLKTGATA